MMNQLVIIGRLLEDIKSEKMEGNEKVANITLAVPRNYKNEVGEYDTDYINIILRDNLAENTSEFCKKGDLIGIKGRLQSRQVEENGKTKNKMEIIAEKVTYLAKKED